MGWEREKGTTVKTLDNFMGPFPDILRRSPRLSKEILHRGEF